MHGMWGLQAGKESTHAAPRASAGAVSRWLCANQSAEKYFNMFPVLLSELYRHQMSEQVCVRARVCVWLQQLSAPDAPLGQGGQLL